MLYSDDSWLFTPLPPKATVWEVILWWEARRIPYNLIIGLVGSISFLLYLFAIGAAGKLEPGEDTFELVSLFIGPILVNICYTAGPVVQVISRTVFRAQGSKLEVTLFTLGLLFSLAVVTFPAVMWTIIWVATLLGIG